MKDNHSPLTSLLCQDSESRAFFSTLSPELRRLLLKQDISTFSTLKSCAEIYASAKGEPAHPVDMHSCSATECTGIFPSGSQLTGEDYDSLDDLKP